MEDHDGFGAGDPLRPEDASRRSSKALFASSGLAIPAAAQTSSRIRWASSTFLDRSSGAGSSGDLDIKRTRYGQTCSIRNRDCPNLALAECDLGIINGQPALGQTAKEHIRRARRQLCVCGQEGPLGVPPGVVNAILAFPELVEMKLVIVVVEVRSPQSGKGTSVCGAHRPICHTDNTGREAHAYVPELQGASGPFFDHLPPPTEVAMCVTKKNHY